MPEIENDDEYRMLKGVSEFETPEAQREAQRAILRYESLNPGIGEASKRTGLEVLEANPHHQAQQQNLAFAEENDRITAERDAEQARLPQEVRDADRGVEEAMGRRKIRQLFPEQTELSDSADTERVPGLAYNHLTIDPEEETQLYGEGGALSRQAEAYQHLANASKDPQLYMPPEFIPEGMGDVRQVLEAERFFEPDVEEFRQVMGPELQQQGIDVNTLDEESPQYKAYADQKWAGVYNRAASMNRAVVRDAFKQDRSWADEVMSQSDKLKAGVYAVAEGTLPGLGKLVADAPKAWGDLNRLSHLPQREQVIDETLADSARRNPTLSTAATLVAAVNPASPLAKVAGGAYRGLSAGAKGGIEAAGFGRRLAAATLGGGLAGAVGAATDLGAEMIDPEEAAPGAGEEASKRALLSVGAGSGGGALGESLGTLAGMGMKSLRNSKLGEKLELAEKAGYQTSVLSKVKPTPELQSEIDAARARGVRHPYVEMAEDVAQKGAQTAHDIQAETSKTLGRNVEGYYKATDSNPDSFRPPLETIDRTIDTIKRLRTGEGDVPFENTAPLRHQFSKMVRARVVGEQDASAALAARPGAKVYSLDELKDMGFTPQDVVSMAKGDVPDWLKKAGKNVDTPDTDAVTEWDSLGFEEPTPKEVLRSTKFTDPSDTSKVLEEAGTPEAQAALEQALVPWESLGEPTRSWKVIIEPIKMSARNFDAQVNALDRAAGETLKSTGKSHPMYQQLMQAAHADREAFPAHPSFAPAKRVYEISDSQGKTRKVSGWAALKAQNDDVIREQKDTFSAAGLPEEIPNRRARQVKGTAAEQREGLRQPKEVYGKPLPKMNKDEWDEAIKTVMNLHGPGNEDALLAQRAWDKLANNPDNPFAEELARVAGTRFGEELRNGGGGLRAVAGTGFMPSIYASVGEGARLRADPLLRGLSGVPAESPEQIVGSNLRKLLGLMRRGDKAQARAPGSVTLGQHVFGLRGGKVGARAAATAEGDSDKLTQEDLENLRKLIQARKAN